MNKLFTYFLFIIMLIATANSVFAWMPETHTYINDLAISGAPNNEVTKAIKNNYDDFIACNVLADISVFYYFSEGFNKISTTYRATHTQSLCTKMVSSATNEQQLACAYGVCSHEAQDSVSHNDFVPKVIKSTKLVNGVIHIFAEEKVNDDLKTSTINNKIRQALSNVAPRQKEFFRQNLVYAGSDFPFDAMYDAFWKEVVGESKFSVGFRGFTAVPFQIHLILVSLFIVFLTIIAYLIKKGSLNTANKFSIVLLAILSLFIVLVYILFFTGKLWLFFQYASYPISQIMPVGDTGLYIRGATTNTINLLTMGSNYVVSLRDPAGVQALTDANNEGSIFRLIFVGITIILIGFFIYISRKNK